MIRLSSSSLSGIRRVGADACHWQVREACGVCVAAIVCKSENATTSCVGCRAGRLRRGCLMSAINGSHRLLFDFWSELGLP